MWTCVGQYEQLKLNLIIFQHLSNLADFNLTGKHRFIYYLENKLRSKFIKGRFIHWIAC